MDNFFYYLPTKVYFGNGIINEIGNYLATLNKPNVLLITDAGLLKAGVADKVIDIVKNSGCEVTIFSEIEPNPRTSTMEKAAQLGKEFNCGCIIGLGGGSSLDCAKMVATIMKYGGTVLDYEGKDKIPGPVMPFIVIPTTAGTASEVTPNAVATDKDRNFKAVVASYYIFPTVAFLDPELTVTLPASITASTGMDAFTHAFESLTNSVWHPVAEPLASRSIELIANNLRKAVYNGSDITSRYNMLLGSYLAGMAFSYTRCGIVHALSHPLGGYFDIPHGIANAVLLPVVAEFNLWGCVEESIKAAQLMGEQITGLSKWDAAEKCIKAIRKLSDDVGIPRDFKYLNASEEQIKAMAKDSMVSGNIPVNPRKVNEKDMYNLLKKVL